jgi:hypothetical protein
LRTLSGSSPRTRWRRTTDEKASVRAKRRACRGCLDTETRAKVWA